MAVLAQTGREIDGHLQQLRDRGTALRPDVVIYQWYINDIELVPSLRPGANRSWRRTFVHRFLVKRSYLWYFVDYHVNNRLSEDGAYERYLSEQYAEDSASWNDFSRMFTQWCTLATEATPRVMVVFYPLMGHPSGAPPTFSIVGQTFIGRVRQVCPEVQYLDLTTAFSRFEDARDLMATRYDAHPSAAAHAVMADEITRSLGRLWPDLFARGGNPKPD
jgi:hypothetical protein